MEPGDDARAELSPTDRADAIALFASGTKATLVASMLIGRGYPKEAATRWSEELAAIHGRARPPAPPAHDAEITPARAEPPAESRGAAGIGNIVIGLLFIGGGASGQLALRGTGSSVALVVVGVGLVIWGAVRRWN